MWWLLVVVVLLLLQPTTNEFKEVAAAAEAQDVISIFGIKQERGTSYRASKYTIICCVGYKSPPQPDDGDIWMIFRRWKQQRPQGIAMTTRNPFSSSDLLLNLEFINLNRRFWSIAHF